jgi:hypothetical protein
MRFFVTHTGFIKGKPQRYRHVGQMTVLMETPVEIRKVPVADAPVVYRLHDVGSEITEFRLIDGFFHRKSSQQKLKDARHGTISVERLQQESSIQNYKTRCNWRSYSNDGIGPRGTLADARLLHEWKAVEIDAVDASVFSDAVTAVADNFVIVGTSLWEKCFEPCLGVLWTTSLDGTHVHARLIVDNVGGPNGVVDGERPDGLPSIHDSAYRRIGFRESREHLRCFSAREMGRAKQFIDGLKAGAVNFRVSLNLGVDLVVEEPLLASADFDLMELRRSARTHLAAVEALAHEIKKTKINFSQDELHARVSDLHLVLELFEAENGPPEDVLEAMAELKEGLIYATTAFATKSVNLSAFIPPDYFGDVDSFSIDLNIASSPTGIHPRL